MAYDRPSWKEIDNMKDGGGSKKRRDRKPEEIKEHSTRYAKYKNDLNRLFDQGMAGELLKKMGKDVPNEPAEPPRETPKKPDKEKRTKLRGKSEGRIPSDTTASTSRLKLIRAITDAEDQQNLIAAINELLMRFGLPDDWDVLIRALEHPDERLIHTVVGKIKDLLPGTARIPRRATLKERLRSISQTASGVELRELAAAIEEKL